LSSLVTTDFLEYRKLKGFVNQTSPVPPYPCRHILFSNLALSAEASSGCLNRNKLFAVPSRSLRKAFLFNILKTRLFAPCSPQQSLGPRLATGSPGAASLPATPHLRAPQAQHCLLPARWGDIPHPAGHNQDKANRQAPPVCLPTPL